MAVFLKDELASCDVWQAATATVHKTYLLLSRLQTYCINFCNHLLTILL